MNKRVQDGWTYLMIETNLLLFGVIQHLQEAKVTRDSATHYRSDYVPLRGTAVDSLSMGCFVHQQTGPLGVIQCSPGEGARMFWPETHSSLTDICTRTCSSSLCSHQVARTKGGGWPAPAREENDTDLSHVCLLCCDIIS